jgi:predicted hydrocarbon binding protein
MIELEIQALSERRQGLLVEIGHSVITNGFTLQRQRLVRDPHGILLTMVIRGPARKKRALQAALDADERIISFQLAPFVAGEQKPHFAASRTLSNYVPAPMPPPEPAAEAAEAAIPGGRTTPASSTAAFDEVAPARLVAAPEPIPNGAAPPTPERIARSQLESTPDFKFILPEPQAAPPAPPSAVEAPFVEVVPLEPDEGAIAKVLSKLDTEYPQIMPRLQTLATSVPEAARESSLRLAGQRIGRWVSARDHGQTDEFDLIDAIARVGVPALQALVDVEQEGGQLRIRHSPLCAETGHSGCTFVSGFLDSVLAPVLVSREVTIFQVCCSSYGADDCVLALSD